jgi:ankyrin repeat protein
MVLCQHGYTALDYAAQRGDANCIQFLVAHGADVHFVDTVQHLASFLLSFFC